MFTVGGYSGDEFVLRRRIDPPLWIWAGLSAVKHTNVALYRHSATPTVGIMTLYLI